jgi:DNA modification methylase
MSENEGVGLNMSKELIKQIQDMRSSKVIAYVTGDKQPIGAIIAEDAVRPLYEHLLSIWDVDYINSMALERVDFPTRKPEALLNRIILSPSNEGDLVADFFCGSGTTLAVTEKLGRRWFGCDLSKYAIQVTRKRLLDIHNSNDLMEGDKE